MKKISTVLIVLAMAFVLGYFTKPVSACLNSQECGEGMRCVSSGHGGTKTCEPNNDGGGGGAATSTFKCTCTGAYSACGNFAGRTNVKRRVCTFTLAGTINCQKIGTGSSAKYYQIVACSVNPTSTPKPTVTPGGPSVTPLPQPTVNPLCVCNAANTCSNKCIFHKQAGITTYVNPVKCTAAVTFFATAPNAANKTDWCRRQERTKGDANGDDKVTLLDYFYYLSAKFAGKVPSTINPDFNGDGQINTEDRAIIIKTL